MAVGPKTNALIDAYKLDIKNKRENREQIEETLKGYKVTDEDGNTLAEIQDLNVAISNFDPAVKGLDTEVLRINNLINDQQNLIFDIYTEASSVGCTTYTIQSVGLIRDDVRGYAWSFSGDNPFVESNTLITSSNVGYGTYTGITTSGLGTFHGLDSTECPGYATSISNAESTITSLRSDRNSLLSPLNQIKKDRATFELQRYGYNNAIAQIDEGIQESESAIAVLLNSENSQYYQE
jgi:hypothetical protein